MNTGADRELTSGCRRSAGKLHLKEGIVSFCRVLVFVLIPFVFMATAGSHAQVDEEVADKLIAGFKRGIDSSDADEQVAVILALKDADCSQAADYLLKVLDEDDIVLKIAVYETLKSYKNPETLETIIKKGLMSRKAEVRRWSAVSLGYMPDPAPEAAAMLLKTLKK